MIPVACVGVHYKFGPCPQIFVRALTQFPDWAAWLNWQEIPLCRTLTMAPQARRLPPSLAAPYKRGGCPLWHCPPPMPTWRVDAPGPFPRVARAHYTAPVAFWRYDLLDITYYTCCTHMLCVTYYTRYVCHIIHVIYTYVKCDILYML